MELRQYGRILARFWWLLLLGTVLAAGSGYYFSKLQMPVYRAATTLLVNEDRNSPFPDYSAYLISERLTRTYGELLRKTPVLDATILRLRLPYDPSQLAARVQVRVIRDTLLLELSAEHESAELARDIANTLAGAFIAQRVEDQLGESSASREILRLQIADLEREMKAAAQALEQAKAGQNTEAGEVTRLQSALSQAQLTYSQLLKTEQEMRLAEARAFSSIRVADPAGTPRSPVRPNVLQNTLLAALAGLLLALGAVFLCEYLDDTIKAAADVHRAIDLATLGAVARLPAARGHDKPPRLLGDGATRAQALVRSAELLQRIPARAFGVVLNKLSPKADDYCYNYYQYGGYHSAKPDSSNGAEQRRLKGKVQ